MRVSTVRLLLAVGAACAIAAPATADFAGQPILGPLSLGSVVNGNTIGKADDNDGFTSGMHFFDIWRGGDDVYRLNWGGGDLIISLSNDTFADNDLFLYTPGSYDDSSIYSTFGPGLTDMVQLNAAPAGVYYINVDSPAGDEGAYGLSITTTPGPAAAGLLGLALAARRSRRR